jgi:hypothetical protein
MFLAKWNVYVSYELKKKNKLKQKLNFYLKNSDGISIINFRPKYSSNQPNISAKNVMLVREVQMYFFVGGVRARGADLSSLLEKE